MNLLEDLQAEREIRKLLAVYCHHADDYDHVAWAALFTPEGQLRAGERLVTGRDGLVTWLEKIEKAMGATRHLLSNAAITIESPTTASGVVDIAVLSQADGRWVARSVPRYRDRYVRTDAGWRFAERTIEPR